MKILLLIITILGVVSCGGGGGDSALSGEGGNDTPNSSDPDNSSSDTGSGESSSSGITLSGISQLGPIEAASVQAFSIDEDGEIDETCSEPDSTDVNGSWELKVTCSDKDIVIISSGGFHYNESDGEKVQNSDNDKIQTFIPEFDGEVAQQLEAVGGVGIDPVTNTASKVIIEKKQPGISYKEIYEAAVPAFTETFGVRPFGPCSNPNKAGNQIDPEREDDKKMFVVAGFNKMIKDNFGGECDELAVEKLLTKDLIDFKQDGKIGSGTDAVVISSLTNEEFQKILGDVDCNFDKVREVFLSAKDSVESGTGSESLMKHIQDGAEAFAAEKLVNLELELKVEPVENPLDMTQFPEYDEKRDRAHADYDPTKDKRVPIYNPYNDENLLGKGTVTIDPKKDPCNELFDPDDDGNIDYDPAKDFCKLAKEQFKKDLALGLTPDPGVIQNFIQNNIEVHYYEGEGESREIKDDFKANIDLVLIQREDVNFEMDKIKMFDNEVIKQKIIEADQIIEKFDDKKKIINMVNNGNGISAIGSVLSSSPTPLEGVWRSQVCERDGKKFYKEVVKFQGSLVFIERNPFDDSLCQRPSDISMLSDLDYNELYSSGSIVLNEASGYFEFQGLAKSENLFLGYEVDGQVLKVGLPQSESEGSDLSSVTSAPDCSSPVVGCFSKLEVENPLAYNEREFAESEIDKDFKNIEEQFNQLDAVFTKSSLVFTASEFILNKTIFKDKNCKIPEDEFVTTGTFSAGDLDVGDFTVDFTEDGDTAPNYFAKILVFDENPEDSEVKWTGVLGDDLFGVRGHSAEMRADFFNFQKLSNLFTREGGTIDSLTGTWETDCVESRDIYMEYLDTSDIGNIGEINIANEVAENVDFYVPPGENGGPQFGYHDSEELIDGDQGPDFSDSNDFLFSSPQTSPHDYSNPIVSSSSTSSDFDGVFVGSCEGGVGILSFDKKDSNGGQVKFDCEGDVIEGNFKVDKILNESDVFEGYYKLDIAGGYKTIKQTVAVLNDGRIAFAKGDCLEDGCGRPPISDIALADEDYNDYFYKVDNQFAGINLNNTSSKNWSSSCRCRDHECGDSSLYEKMTISFEYVSGDGMSNGGNFTYARTLYVDDACTKESEIQDDEGSAEGEYYFQPEHIITYENGEYILASYLYLDSNLPLSANSDNCFSYTIEDSGEEVEKFNCEAGLMVLIDGQLMLDEGDNNKQAYYDDQYEFENASEFENQFNEHDGAGGFVFSKLFDEIPYKFPFEIHAEKQVIPFNSISDISSYFSSHLSAFSFDCDLGDKGTLIVSGMAHITCGDSDPETYSLDSANPGKLIIDESSSNLNNLPEVFYISKVEGDEEMLFVSQDVGLLTGNKAGAKLGYEVGDFSSIDGTYLTPCLPDFESMKFIKEKITFNETTSNSIKFSRIVFQDPSCDSPEGVDFQTEGTYSFELGDLDYVKDLVIIVDQNTDGKCIDNNNGTFECRPGEFVCVGNYLIPINEDDQGQPEEGGSSTFSFTSEMLSHFGGDCPSGLDSECPSNFPTCIVTELGYKCSDKKIGAYCMSGESCLNYNCDMMSSNTCQPMPE
jgi:hypothetical protein